MATEPQVAPRLKGCWKCNGSGLLRVKDSGQARFIPCPVCQQVQRVRADGLPEHMREWRFDNSIPYPQVAAALDGTREALERRFGATFVTLYGPNGTGKTNVLACAMNWAWERQERALFSTVVDLLDGYKARFGQDREYRAYDEMVRAVPVLCLDEFTRYNESPWAVSLVENLLGARYQPGKFITLLAFNGVLGPATVGGYLYTRLTDALHGRAYSVTGEDLRRFPAER